MKSSIPKKLKVIKTGSTGWPRAPRVQKSTTPPQGAGYEASSVSSSPQAAGNMTHREMNYPAASYGVSS